MAHSSHEQELDAVLQVGRLRAESLVEEFGALNRLAGIRVFDWVDWVVRVDFLDRLLFEHSRNHVGADHRGHHEFQEITSSPIHDDREKLSL